MKDACLFVSHLGGGKNPKLSPVGQDQVPAAPQSYATSEQMTGFLLIIIKAERSLNVVQISAYAHHILHISTNFREVKSGLLRKHSRISFLLLLKL